MGKTKVHLDSLLSIPKRLDVELDSVAGTESRRLADGGKADLAGDLIFANELPRRLPPLTDREAVRGDPGESGGNGRKKYGLVDGPREQIGFDEVDRGGCGQKRRLDRTV
jgi:hypothetical protein